MPFSDTILQRYRAGTLNLVEKLLTYSADGSVDRVVQCPGGATTEVLVAFNFADLVSALVKSSVGAVTLLTNSSGAPDDTIAVGAGKEGALVWATDLGDNPFTVNVTKIFVTVAGSSPDDDTEVRMRFLHDSTP